MTSNLASVAQEDCFCTEDYTGALDCTGRANVTHHRCDAGYTYIGRRTGYYTGVEYDDCSICSSGDYCDGTSHFQCPTEDLGVMYTFGKKTYADCFCPFGYTLLTGDGSCVPCPPDGVQNASTAEHLWTRGVNCAVTNMSVVSFTTTLAVSVDEFNAKRGEFAIGVAQALWVPVGTVAVGQASETAAGQRRLLAPASVDVTSAVTVPTADAAFVVAATTPENLARALGTRALTVAAVSAPTQEVQNPAGSTPANSGTPTTEATSSTPTPGAGDDDPSSSSMLVIIVAVSGAGLLVVGAIVWGWCCKPPESTGYAEV